MLLSNERNYQKNLLRLFILTSFLILLFIPDSHAATTGKISGTVYDAETGETIPSTVVMIPEHKLGAQTDLDGRFTIMDVPPGAHTVEVKVAGYANMTINNVEVVAGKTYKLEPVLKPEAFQDEDVVVEAKMDKTTIDASITRKKNADVVMDIVSVDEISKAGGGTAAEGLSRVVGGSTTDGGKKTIIRGAPGRFVSFQMNGTEMTSADPNEKTYHTDMIPSDILENISVEKTFSPDKPGNFSGGVVNINTKTFPESFTLKASVSSSYNTLSTYEDNFLRYEGGDDDWLGMDDGTRDLPDMIKERDIPSFNDALTDNGKAWLLDTLSKEFNGIYNPYQKSAPLNGSYAFSVGNKTTLFGQEFGYMGSLNYRRSYDFYEGGRVARYRVKGDQASTLDNEWAFSDSRGTEDVFWGGLFTSSYKLHRNHEFTFNYIHSQNGESQARYLTGRFFDGNLPDGSIYETRVLGYTERTQNTYQFNGKNYMPGILKSTIEWNFTYNDSKQDQPDLRFFSNDYTIDEETGERDYGIQKSGYTLPTRYYRELHEKTRSFSIKWSIPFKQWNGLNSKVSFGSLFSEKNRNNYERIFRVWTGDRSYNYDGDPDAFFSDDNFGIVDSTYNPFSQTWRYVYNLYYVDMSEDRSNYTGDENIDAGFAMIELPLHSKLKFIGGARYERTYSEVVTQDSSYASGIIDEDDILPSVNMIYKIGENMNLRGAYGRTLARPNFREMAPVVMYEFADGYYFVGNPNLKRTLIDNFDLRWEIFPRIGEVMAASLFYKHFDQPIERAIKHENGEIQYQNVDEARVYGAEFEIRKRLDFMGKLFRNFSTGANLSLIHSAVKIPELRLSYIKEYDPNAKDTRPLQGQSDYIVNFMLSYDNYASNTSATVSFNVYGERLSEVAERATPDIYEQPRPELNFVMSQGIFSNFTFKMSVKNILNSTYKKVHTYLDEDYVSHEHDTGRKLSLGISYSI